ncbi:sigma-54-dependent transcriptional regulator [Roseivirga sp. BDSF3-8]|uniref:sigma-54-dependent transcriptional regulator n=1 Tax=Roseivirga sp. BDSF3-8 TaxID=3241598 RepID=UPI00353184B7
MSQSVKSSKIPGKILVVDDNQDVLSAARLFLKRHFTSIDIEKNPEAIPTLMNNEQYDVILLDMNFTKDVSSGHEGFYWLDKILAIDPSAVVVLITAYGDVQTAVRAIKEGASDFVLKPWENEKLLATMMSAMRLRQSRTEVADLKDKQKQINEDNDFKYVDILGKSGPMQKVFETIDRVAGTDANVLILGENGTGKELVARAIHRKSKRHDGVFISVDLGAITESLFESELFGHTKGAFTDAKEERAGRFEVASGGTLFLDEIGNLSLPLQAKLLSAIQSRQVTRVGSNKTRDVDIRLICATNMNLYDMVGQNSFRQDLLYRVNTIEIILPPLRERGEDLELLADHYLKHYAHKYSKEVHSVSAAALKRMQKYNWPGNVRELQHAVERAVIMSQSNVLQPEDFFFNARPGEQSGGQGEENIQLEQYHLEEVEKILIRKVMKKYNGNITQAATELGLTRSSLYRRLEKYGL